MLLRFDSSPLPYHLPDILFGGRCVFVAVVFMSVFINVYQVGLSAER